MDIEFFFNRVLVAKSNINFRYRNADYANLIGLYSLLKVNKYEKYFLRFIKYRLYVSLEDVQR
jgi:hypothetical protein